MTVSHDYLMTILCLQKLVLFQGYKTGLTLERSVNAIYISVLNGKNHMIISNDG